MKHKLPMTIIIKITVHKTSVSLSPVNISLCKYWLEYLHHCFLLFFFFSFFFGGGVGRGVSALWLQNRTENFERYLLPCLCFPLFQALESWSHDPMASGWEWPGSGTDHETSWKGSRRSCKTLWLLMPCFHLQHSPRLCQRVSPHSIYRYSKEDIVWTQ